MLTSEEKQFVHENLDSDVNKLLLSPPAIFKDNIQFLVDQILSRRKAKDKLPIWYSNPDLILPPPISIEQSSSELLASYKSKLVTGKLLIDLTGGMGVDCMAMSKSFDLTIYVEADSHLCECFKHNAEILGETIEVVNKKAESFLDQNFPAKTVFFIDPDRRSDAGKMVRFSDCYPDVTVLIDRFKKVATQVLIKASPLLDIKAGIKALEGVSEVHVLSIKSDCKEVLFLLDFTRDTPEPIIKTVNFSGAGVEAFDFKFSEEQNATSSFSEPKAFLLLPNASILKAGAFKTISYRFELSKIAANTHIYTSDNPVADFPGRRFKVISDKVTSGEIKEYLPRGMVNVITRNYPAKPEEILKKFKLKEGGELFLIGFRNGNGESHLLLCRKI